ncbi:hypothetical protein [Bacillus sp. FSL W8-0183]|uniref:hypothetical protein n=1 Tax=Bacillus sp. FSL W8-0183 TaxID=2954568 RepID=UPI0030FC1832
MSAEYYVLKQQIRNNFRDFSTSGSTGGECVYEYGICHKDEEEILIVTNINHGVMRYIVCYVYWQIENKIPKDKRSEAIKEIINLTFPIEKKKRLSLPERCNILEELLEVYVKHRITIENELKMHEALNENIKKIMREC